MFRKILGTSAIISALAILPASVQAATASATASATVLTPIAIATNTQMSFGDLYADNVAIGTVVLAVDGSRTVTGPVAKGATAGAAAAFTVTGTNSATYALTLPSTDVTITSAGSDTMIVNTFTHNSTTTLSAGGTESFNVGATLNVGISQVATSYSGSFNVTVNYN